MLIDTRKKQPEGKFEPVVQNEIISPKPSGGSWFIFILICIITLGIYAGVVFIGERNKLNKQQMDINQAASNIEIQYTQRCATLTKLVGAVQSSIKFEKDTLTEVTSLRSQKFTPSNIGENISRLDAVGSKINAVLEQYPNLKSVDLVSELMANSDYQEREIAASKRIYNSLVTDFNRKIVIFPYEFPAKRLNCHTLALITASEEEKKDVDTKVY